MLFGGPPLFIVGDNGIGKTTMVEACQSAFRTTSFFFTDLEYGFLRKVGPDFKKAKINTIVLGDIQKILSRNNNVRDSTFGDITSLISEGVGVNGIFDKDKIDIEALKRKSKEKRWKMNFILVGTVAHLGEIFDLRQLDILNRMVIVPVERAKTNFSAGEFKLAMPMVKFFDKEVYARCKPKRFDMDARHTEMLNRLIRQLNSMHVDGIDFIRRCGLTFFSVPPQNSRGITDFKRALVLPNFNELPEEPEPPAIDNPQSE